MGDPLGHFVLVEVIVPYLVIPGAKGSSSRPGGAPMGDSTTRPDTAQSMVAASLFIYPDGKSAHTAAAPSSQPPAASASQMRPPRRPQSPLFRRTSLQGGGKAAAGAEQAPQRRRPDVSAPAHQQPQQPGQQPEQKAPRHRRPDAAAPAPTAAIPFGDDEFRSSSDAHRSSLSGISANGSASGRGSGAGPSPADVRAEAFLQRFPNSPAADVLRKRMSESSGEGAAFPALQTQHQRQHQCQHHRRQPEPPLPQQERRQQQPAAASSPPAAVPGHAARRGLPLPQPSASPPVPPQGDEAAEPQVWGTPSGTPSALSGASSGSSQFPAGALQASGGDRTPWSAGHPATGYVHAGGVQCRQ